MAIIPLILSGGAGTRLWPASREARPKQFLALFGNRSTFQETLLRFGDDPVFGRPIVMTNRDHRFLVSEQIAALKLSADILLEPIRRDSGPAIAAGAHYVGRQYGGQTVVLVVAADHVIEDPVGFVTACKEAAHAAEKGYIVTLGMTPDSPSTSYGYLKPSKKTNGSAVRALERFVEKPDAQTAARYLKEGLLWNSGNFIFQADTLLREYATIDPDTEKAARDSVAKAVQDLDFLVLDERAFGAAKALSIDFAVMEHTQRAAVLPASFGWSDVGSWDAVWSLSPKDDEKNVTKGPVMLSGCQNNLVFSDRVLTAALGVDGLVIVATEDAILVGKRDDANALKALVSSIKSYLPNLAELGARVYRPWGSYQSLDNGDRYQVKRIVVKPGGRLSLQKHHHRSEHWVVVRGTAQVTIGDQTRMVHENESVYIPIGTVHRLENPGKIDIEIIEVQTGSYLGEDDIIRLEDVYNRTSERVN